MYTNIQTKRRASTMPTLMHLFIQFAASEASPGRLWRYSGVQFGDVFGILSGHWVRGCFGMRCWVLQNVFGVLNGFCPVSFWWEQASVILSSMHVVTFSRSFLRPGSQPWIRVRSTFCCSSAKEDGIVAATFASNAVPGFAVNMPCVLTS